MNHLVLGGAAPFLVGLLIYVARGFHASFRLLVAVPVFMALGMLWAAAPDLPRLLRCHGLYARLSNASWCDVFLWHYSLDQVESDSGWFVPVLAAMLASLVLAAWRELRLAERNC